MRYSRHDTLLGDVNKKLRKLKVAIIGLGGLGSFTSDFLVRSGVSKILLIDRDIIDLPDLHRQILYSEKDLNLPKAYAAYRRLKEINSDVDITYFVGNLDHSNIDMLKEYDIIIDGTDNLETRYLINEFSVKYKKPWVFSSIIGFKGFAGLFVPGKTPCFEEIFPEKISYQTCETAGVFNAAVAFVSSIQTKLLLDFVRDRIESVIYSIDFDKLKITKIKVKRRECRICDHGQFKYLEGKGVYAEKICGGGVTIDLKREIDIERFCEQYECLNKTEQFVRIKINDVIMIITRSGTIMIPSLKEVSEAKKIVSKYLGLI